MSRPPAGQASRVNRQLCVITRTTSSPQRNPGRGDQAGDDIVIVGMLDAQEGFASASEKGSAAGAVKRMKDMQFL